MSSFSYVFLGLGIAVGFIAFLFILRAVVRAIAIRRPRLATGGLTLFIDEASGELVVSQREQTGVERFALGTLTWAVSAPSLRITTFDVQAGLAVGKFYQYDKTTVVRSTDFWVGDGNPEAAKRWLDHRAARLAPDVSGHVRQLNAQKKDIAAAARRHLPEKPVIECDAGRVIERYAYVAFLPSGFVYGMRGADGIPAPVMRVHAGHVASGNGRTVSVVFLDGTETFGLSPSQMDTLQVLQQKGLLRLEPALPN